MCPTALPRQPIGREIPRFGNYLLVYRPITDGIELLRVLHGARDLSRFYVPPASDEAAQ